MARRLYDRGELRRGGRKSLLVVLTAPQCRGARGAPRLKLVKGGGVES